MSYSGEKKKRSTSEYSFFSQTISSEKGSSIWFPPEQPVFLGKWKALKEMYKFIPVQSIVEF